MTEEPRGAPLELDQGGMVKVRECGKGEGGVAGKVHVCA